MTSERTLPTIDENAWHGRSLAAAGGKYNFVFGERPPERKMKRNSQNRRPLSSVQSGENNQEVLNSSSLSSLGIQSTTKPMATRSLSSHCIARSGKKSDISNSKASTNLQPMLHNSAKIALSISPTADNSLNLTESSEINSGVQKIESSRISRSERIKKPKLAAVFSGDNRSPVSKDNPDSYDEGCEVRIATLEKSQGSHEYKHTSVRPGVPLLMLADSATLKEAVAAAITIQRWFREKNTRNLGASRSSVRTGTVEVKMNQQTLEMEKVKILLQEKKSDLDRSKKREMDKIKGDLEAHNRKVIEKQQKRAAKLAADRRVVIDDLQKKKEEKKRKNIKLVSEEMVRFCRIWHVPELFMQLFIATSNFICATTIPYGEKIKAVLL